MRLFKHRIHALLRWSERYTRTDMVYLASSGFWLNLNTIATAVLAFLLSVAFANLLPKHEYGVYQYVLAIASLLTAFTLTGMNAAITQSVARGREGVVRSSIPVQLLWNAVPGAVALLFAAYYVFAGNHVLALGMACVSLAVPITSACNSYGAYLNGRGAFRAAALYAIAGSAIYYLCIFAAVFLYPTASVLVLVNLLVTAGIAAAIYVRTVRTYPPNERDDPGAFGYARHMTVMNALGMIAAHIDKLLVFQFLGAPALAAYGLATLLPDKLGGLFKPIFSAAFPRFANRTVDEIRIAMPRKLALMFAAAVGSAGAYALIAPTLISLVYPAYTDIIPYSQVYALTFIATVGHLAGVALMAHKQVRGLYVLNAAVPLIQIGMLVVGIMMWGLWGLIAARVLAAALFSATAGLLLSRRSI